MYSYGGLINFLNKIKFIFIYLIDALFHCQAPSINIPAMIKSLQRLVISYMYMHYCLLARDYVYNFVWLNRLCNDTCMC